MIDTQQGDGGSHNPYLPVNQVPRDMTLGRFEDCVNYNVFSAIAHLTRTIRGGQFTFGDLGVLETECTNRARAIARGSHGSWPMMDYDSLRPSTMIAAVLPAQGQPTDTASAVSAWATITHNSTVTGTLDLADTQVMPAITA